MNKVYACIDLKSFYASVECVERNLDPINTNLVVADKERTEKTICLAVTPSLKQFGIKGRARLFEVISKVKEINRERLKKNNYKKLIGKSYFLDELERNKNLELDYIIAKPRMKKYLEYSTKIYNIYLKFLSKEDIYVYSIDEIFCDITNYLKYYNMQPKELVTKMIEQVYKETGITATAGIGENLYIAKVCMDIVAKHALPNEHGVRISEMTQRDYKEQLWDHKPITDFWRIGRGISKKLEENKIYTMKDIALTSLENENLLYKLFGVNAELIIDHAWGYEPTTLKDVKNYVPKNRCITTGQVLHCAYNYEQTKLIIKEMTELLSLELVEKKLKTNQLVITLNYDVSNMKDIDKNKNTVIDIYGRIVPKPSHGTINIDYMTCSTKTLTKKSLELYERIIDKNMLVKKINIIANNITPYEDIIENTTYDQLDFFDNKLKESKQKEQEKKEEMSEQKLQETIINLKNKYGKNSILKGMNLDKYSTAIDRNSQIGGHSE